jgi:hypothetical protein
MITRMTVSTATRTVLYDRRAAGAAKLRTPDKAALHCSFRPLLALGVIPVMRVLYYVLQGFGDGRYLQIRPSGSYHKSSWSCNKPYGSNTAGRSQGPPRHHMHPADVDADGAGPEGAGGRLQTELQCATLAAFVCGLRYTTLLRSPLTCPKTSRCFYQQPISLWLPCGLLGFAEPVAATVTVTVTCVSYCHVGCCRAL